MADSTIRHVSDTALWVATFRAQEGQRADAAFDDPLASILSGERGRAIARSIPRAEMVEWGMIIRTSAIDRLMMMRCFFMSICLAAITPTQAASLLDLASLRGRVVYLDFWASWCGPCKQSFPWMQSMKEAYERQGLTVVAVNLDRHRADANRFLELFKPTFEVRFDPNGELAETYKVGGMPSSVLIDRHGVARFTHVGFRPADGAVYEAQLRELLGER